ncbi:hypothetical protein [Streptomyces sp. NBC_01324]|uniref:hypothetical protein n=1 Tax=Streptomyces sp. NBC_01324 TaxID=2903826 RepID=UPI002E13C650
MSLPAGRAGRLTKLSTRHRGRAARGGGIGRVDVSITSTVHHIAAAGAHVLKCWMADPAVVLQSLVIDIGDPGPSCLGPPERLRRDRWARDSGQGSSGADEERERGQRCAGRTD